MYIRDPEAIEARSMEIIRGGLKPICFSGQELKIIMRAVHTTGDFDYQDITAIKPGAIEAGLSAIRAGCRIVTDTRMAYSGINKRSLEASGCRLDCYISDAEIYRLARENQITRSMASMDFAARDGVDIFVIGNAPTALYRIGELIREGIAAPKLVVGVPVGFVGAAESKEYIRGFDIPSITTVGTKGGSNVAAAIMNALIYMAVGKVG